MDKILDTIKTMLGVSLEEETFDTEIKVHINSSLMTINQLGIGVSGFSIKDGTELWSDFLGTSEDLEGTKTYIYLKTRLLFDPPSSSFVLDAISKQITEFEWRLNVQVDKPIPEPIGDDTDV